MSANPIIRGGRIASRMQDRMSTLKISVATLAARSEQSYEHIRKIANGESLPSKSLLRLLAGEIKLPFRELDKLRVADAIERKHGDIPTIISGKNPEMEPLSKMWPLLKTEQKEDLLWMAQGYLRRNRRSPSA